MRPFESLTFEQLAEFPRPGMAVPQSFQFSADGRRLWYLFPREGTATLDLWAWDLESARPVNVLQAPHNGEMTLNEELLRERGRMLWDGITRYQIAGDTVLASENGMLYTDCGEGLVPIADSEEAVSPRLLADGRRVLWVQQGDLVMHSLDTGDRYSVTSGASPGLTHGLAEYVAQEELGRLEGFWVSPDMQWVAYAEVDERQVPEFPIVRFHDDRVGVERHRYPLAGRANAEVRLWITPVTGGASLPVAEGSRPGWYLARVLWDSLGNLVFSWLRRDQRQMIWYRWSPERQTAERLWTEEQPTWINLPDDLPRGLLDGTMLFTSERSGFRHLYQFGRDGQIRQLSHGEWEAQAILDVDEHHQVAYVLATGNDGLERQVVAVNWKDRQIRAVTQQTGWHTAMFSPDHRRFVDQVSDETAAPVTRLLSVDGAEAVLIHRIAHGDAQRYGLTVPELVQIAAPDGVMLNAAVYRPTGGPPADGWPLVVAVYGGPRAQRVFRGWGVTADLAAQFLVQQGYLVFKLDGRGSYGRGTAFEAGLHRRLGTVELADQLLGTSWITQHEPVNAGRIGIFGWSYGGYLTLLAMMSEPQVFRVGVAGAPVTDFRWYDTAYTERYLETPAANPDGYRAASVFSRLSGLRGKLLLIHGMIDENVHFRHTAQLIAGLIAEGKDFDTVLLPDSRHAPRGKPTEIFRLRKMLGYFLDNL
ncbi:MAG: DPP IV N-terminal domain-containing protein [Thermaerobacter sp.]|nr:DPP IV N-terminal domain-containing protein [Thermaerobacter sp.]